MVVTRKAIPRAVDRNRSKRVVREVFRAMSGRFPALDVVVLCREAVPQTEGRAAQEELAGLFHVIGKGANPGIPETKR